MAVSLTTTGITFSDGTSTSTNLIPAGTSMLFIQTAAPTGWTKSTTNNDTTLRVVSGTVSSGGTLNFSSAFTSRGVSGSVNSTTLSAAQMPSHRHNLGNNQGHQYDFSTTDDNNFSTPGASDAGVGGARSWGDEYIGAQGGNGAHNHGFTGTSIDFSIQYVDTIFATKN